MELLIRSLLVILVWSLAGVASAAENEISDPTGFDCSTRCTPGVDYCCRVDPNNANLGCMLTCKAGSFCSQVGKGNPFCETHSGSCGLTCYMDAATQRFKRTDYTKEECVNCLNPLEERLPLNSPVGTTGNCKDCDCPVNTVYDHCNKVVKPGCLFGGCPKEGTLGGPVDQKFLCRIRTFVNGVVTDLEPKLPECRQNVCGCWSCRNPMVTHWYGPCECPNPGDVPCSNDPCSGRLTCCPPGSTCKSDNNGGYTCDAVVTPTPAATPTTPVSNVYIRPEGN